MIGSNYCYDSENLGVKYHQPFDIIANMNTDEKTKSIVSSEDNDTFRLWWAQEESNLSPSGYEPEALPDELWALNFYNF